jgi:bacillithiol system protein YtxJ
MPRPAMAGEAILGGDFQRDDDILDEPAAGCRIRAAFTPVESAAALEAVFAEAATGTTLLFLHDPFCPISAFALEEVEHVPASIHLVDVSRHSHLGKEIERRTGVRHESPQAIVIVAGEVRWHASHGRVRAGALIAAAGIA